MSDEKKPFTVTDRRHFTREGEVRPDAAVETPAPAAPRPADTPRATPEPSRAAEPRVDPRHAEVEASYRRASSKGALMEEDEGGAPLDFVGLLLSLGTQASMMLGMASRPGERPAPPDLPGARSIISLLEVLRDKTAGRRTAEEDEVLEGLLYELRMQYVALSRKSGP